MAMNSLLGSGIGSIHPDQYVQQKYMDMMMRAQQGLCLNPEQQAAKPEPKKDDDKLLLLTEEE